MDYKLLLSHGHTHVGFDERDSEELTLAVHEADMDGLPAGWTWLCGLYVRAADVIGFTICTPETS